MSVKNVSALAVTAVAALIGFGGIAQATPPDDGGQGSCVWTLSKPFVVDVSGVKMVSATLKPLPCTGSLLPNLKTVCVELQGAGMAPLCKYEPGYPTAQVYFAPYRPGSTYISTGSGCGSGGSMMGTSCTSVGPYTATL